jgi:hypothetical protein
MSFGNVPADVLAGAVEKLLAKMNEADLAAFYERELSAMPPDVARAFAEALFVAFRDRGESSDDAAEGAATTVGAIEQGEPAAVGALLNYARTSPDLLKEATTILVEQRPDLISALPADLRERLAERLSV